MKIEYPCDIALKVEIDDIPSIRAHYDRVVASKSASSASELASQVPSYTNLPPLRYGKSTDPLPTSSGWTSLVSYDTLACFYASKLCWMGPDDPLFPCSVPCDGMLDLLTFNTDVSRLAGVTNMLNAGKGQVLNLKKVKYQKVSAYRVIPKYKRGYFAIDGEHTPLEPFQVEVHRGLGATLSLNGKLWATEGTVLDKNKIP